MDWQPGQLAARVELDTSGTVRVWSARIERVEPGAVIDHLGFRHELDRDGDSPTLLPLDNDLARELFEKGEGYVVDQEPTAQRGPDPFDPRPDPMGRQQRDPYERRGSDPFERRSQDPFRDRDPFDRDPPGSGGVER